MNDKAGNGPEAVRYSAAELTAIAHLYRGEVYRSTAWRSRLDNTTNWAVVTSGLALSLGFADANASALPLILVVLLVAVFLGLEARRYRYFNVWRARCRLLETEFYAPLVAGTGVARDGRWDALLSRDLRQPRFHVSYLCALGRRLRKNYVFLLAVMAVAYLGKLAIHPVPAASIGDVVERAAIGPVPGSAVLVVGALFHAAWIAIAVGTLRTEWRQRRGRGALISIG
jgi:uncharacterized membrane protein